MLCGIKIGLYKIYIYIFFIVEITFVKMHFFEFDYI